MHFTTAFLLAVSSTVMVKAVLFQNAENFISCNPATVIAATSTAQVQSIVKGAIAAGQTVKAAGAGHSTNQIICSQNGGIIVQMEGMNSIVRHNTALLQATVQGGAGLLKFQTDLIALNMTIEGMVDYGAITVAGSIATGAHCSSLKIPSGVADHIVAATFVNGLGNLVTLTKGVDSDFSAVHTNLGALGIMVEVTFQAVPLFKLQTQQIVLPQSQMATFPDHLVAMVQQHDYANLYWYPHTLSNAAILHTYNKVSPSTPGNGVRNTWLPEISSLIPQGYYAAIIALNTAFSENEMCLLAETRVLALSLEETSEHVGYTGAMYMGTVCEGADCLFPQVDDVEIAIPLANVAQALYDIKAITDATLVCFPVFGIYVRFGLQSTGTLLGPTRSGPVAYVELHVLRTQNGATPTIGISAIDEIRQLLLVKYGGQAHWGKNFASDFYGKSTPAFNAIASKYDPNGIFQNPFLASTRATNLASYQTSECAFQRTCAACSNDSHCFPGWKCGKGGFYTAASVCKKGSGIHCERSDECYSGTCSWLFECE